MLICFILNVNLTLKKLDWKTVFGKFADFIQNNEAYSQKSIICRCEILSQTSITMELPV